MTIRINYSRKKIATFLIAILSVMFLGTGGIFKYIYLLALGVLLTLFQRKGRINNSIVYKQVSIPNSIYTLLGLCSVIMKGITIDTVKNLFFAWIPLMGVILITSSTPKKRQESIIEILFYAFLCNQIIKMVQYKGFKIETEYSFVFGLYAIYFIFRNNPSKMCLSILGTYVANKRIALFAAVAAVFVYLILQKRRSKKQAGFTKGRRAIIALGIVTSLFLFFWVFACRYGIIEALFIRLRINSFGRIAQWVKFNPYYNMSPFFMGNGVGFTENQLQKIGLDTFRNLHNDIMKFYIELGFLGFFIYIFSYFYYVYNLTIRKKAGYNQAVALYSIIIYTFICCMTDNISIYINYLVPMYMIVVFIANSFDYDRNLFSIQSNEDIVSHK